MTPASIFDHLKNKHNDRIGELSLFLSQGSIKDIAEYQKVCGLIQGLSLANEFLADLAKRLETDDDE